MLNHLSKYGRTNGHVMNFFHEAEPSKPAPRPQLVSVQVETQQSSVDDESSSLEEGNGRLCISRDIKAYLGVALLHQGIV